MAGLTDAADGMLARFMEQRTIIGSYLDPVADKLLSAASFISLAMMGLIPGWLTVLVISRDVLIVGGVLLIFFAAHISQIRPTLISKTTTVFQLLTITAVLCWQIKPLWSPLTEFLIWGTGGLTVVSGLQYIKKGIKLLGAATS